MRPASSGRRMTAPSGNPVREFRVRSESTPVSAADGT
jgi:hypothetical protein